ncbi:radical SAM protein [archaeon]|jgi:MoaA/NifB/PqqE/SkfB family radical SAM enzyme|nr:radical SAM protein [Candidatus Woesearchaeota archaeon]MBT4351366.1 radical SAM protein [archaeon]MBT4647552.1 radical SAM protein [archaeon]MBT6821952.1 radical SAM protein [archaeon]MBT7392347.1 radical SAM protein [archaeon]
MQNKNNLGYKPEFACIGITDYCFFKCKMCDKWKEDIKVIKGTPRPNLEQYKQFIRDLAHLVKENLIGPIDGRFTLNFAGGEALTHAMTIPLIEYASKVGFKTLIATNGFMLNEHMIKRLKNANLTSLSISLDSLDPKIHDSLRGYIGATDGVMKALEILKKYEYPKVGICSIINKQTYSGIPKLIDWSRKHKVVEWLYFMAVMQPNNTVFQSGWYKLNHFNYLWEEKSEKVVKMIDYIINQKVLDEKYIKELKLNQSLLTNTFPQLKAFRDYFSKPEKFVKNNHSCNMDKGIQTTEVGDIFMCFHKNRIGNIREDRLIDVWNNYKTDQIRDNIKSCTTNCHTLLNCYYENDYPFDMIKKAKKKIVLRDPIKINTK